MNQSIITNGSENYKSKNNDPAIYAISYDKITEKMVDVSNRFKDLSTFKQRIKENVQGISHLPYTYNKNNIFWYRLVFLTFGALFLGLGATILSMTTTVGLGLFIINYWHFVKIAMFCICMLFSFCAFLIACSLSAERDSTFQCAKKAKKELKLIYGRKKLQVGGWLLSFSGKSLQTLSHLRHAYHETLEKIHDKRDAALYLLHKISTTPTLNDDEKEILYNQTIEELHDKCTQLLHVFRQT